MTKKGSLNRLATRVHSSFEEWAKGAVRQYDVPEAMGPREQRELLTKLKQTLSKDIPSNSSDNHPVNRHFTSIFAGLETIEKTRESKLLSMPESARIKHIQRTTSGAAVLAMFDVLYYNGRLTKGEASAVLWHPAVTNWRQLYKKITGPGSIVGWPLKTKQTFALEVANRLFKNGEKEEARQFIKETFNDIWKPLLRQPNADTAILQTLLNALLALDPVLLRQEIGTMHLDTRTTPVVWQACCQFNRLDLAAKAVARTDKNTTLLRFLDTLHNHHGQKDAVAFTGFLIRSKLHNYLSKGSVVSMVNFCAKLKNKGYNDLGDRLIQVIADDLHKIPANSRSISASLALQKIAQLEGKRADLGHRDEHVHNLAFASAKRR